MHNAVRELFQTFKVGHIGRGEVTSSNYHVIELVCFLLTSFMIHYRYSELLCVIIKSHPTHRTLKTNVLTDILLINATHNIVFEDFTGRVGRNWFAEVLFERVVSKFKTLFRTIRPQITVHTAVNWFTVTI